MATDFYKILGVDRKADEKEIKRAYRKRAREFHPDANKSAGAEAKFKQINEAYQVLSDSEKRGLYDQFGENYDKVGQAAPPPGSAGYGNAQYSGSGGGMPGGINFEDLLNQARHQQAGGGRADVGDVDASIFEELIGGFRGGRGQGSTRGGNFNFRSRREKQKGGDVEQPLEITLGESIRGATRALQMTIRDPNSPQQQRRNVTVKIPAGVREGARVRIKEQGAAGENGGPNGDLFLKIRIASHPFWKREGDDLHCEIPVAFTEAALGATIDVPTVDGEVKMKIPAGTQSGQKFRLSGRGVPHPKNHPGGGKGDVFVQVKVAVPKNLEPRETELIEELSALRDENVRQNLQAKI